MEENSAPLISFSGADILGGEDNVVVYGLDLQVYPGQLVYIIGKVGSGKTSIFRTITAENPLAKGSGEVCGFNLKRLRAKEVPYLRRKIGVVFQDFQLLMDRSVEDNLAFVLKATGWKDVSAIHKRIGELLLALPRRVGSVMGALKLERYIPQALLQLLGRKRKLIDPRLRRIKRLLRVCEVIAGIG